MVQVEQAISAEVAILDCLQRSSHRHFTAFVPDAESLPLDAGDLSADHWVASVLLNTSKAQVVLRVHFSSAVGRLLLSKAIREDPHSIQPSSAHDFLKEFCNVVMGKVKGILVSEIGKDEAREVFLPHIEPSYDRFGKVPGTAQDDQEVRWWRLKWADGELILFGRATAAQGFTEALMLELSKTGVLLVDDGGEIEFL
jgi:hypothetical protein